MQFWHAREPCEARQKNHCEARRGLHSFGFRAARVLLSVSWYNTQSPRVWSSVKKVKKVVFLIGYEALTIFLKFCSQARSHNPSLTSIGAYQHPERVTDYRLPLMSHEVLRSTAAASGVAS